MDLKDFRTGIETLSRYTNQQKKVADPFLVQVGKDGKVSLVSGNAYGTTVWRTGVNASIPSKNGIDSKTLVQAVKAIKGRGVTVSLKVHHNKFVVEASTGGAIELPYIDLPAIIHRPTLGDIEGTIQINNLDLFSRKVNVTDNDRYPFMSFEKRDGNKVRVISTDGHVAYEADMVGSGDMPEISVSYLGFWDALRGAQTNGEARFVNGGLQLHHAPFEFYTSLVEGVLGYRSWWDELFPKDQTFDVAVKVDRKTVLDLLKKYGPLTTLTVDKEGLAVADPESLTRVSVAQRRGSGVNYFPTKQLANILSALEAESVVLAWNKTDKPALLVRHELAYECFILAPIVRPT